VFTPKKNPANATAEHVHVRKLQTYKINKHFRAKRPSNLAVRTFILTIMS